MVVLESINFFWLNFSVIWTKYLSFGAVTTIYYQQRMSSTNWTHLLSSGSHNYLNSPGCPFSFTVGITLEYSACDQPFGGWLGTFFT